MRQSGRSHCVSESVRVSYLPIMSFHRAVLLGLCLCLTAVCTADSGTPNMHRTRAPCLSCPHHTTTTTARTTPKHTTTLHTTTHPTTIPYTNHTTTQHTTLPHNQTTTPPVTNHTTTLPVTNHTTTLPVTNHTTAPPITNYTTAPPVTNHTTTLPVTNHTTAPPITNHTTTPPVTNHTTAPPITNHTTTPPVTNHTTTQYTSQHTNHTTRPYTAPTNHSTTHYSTTAPTNYTRVPPSPEPTPSDFSVNNTSGTCLRLTAVLEITVNGTERIVVPPPPMTTSEGKCQEDQVEVTLGFPQATLHLAFTKDSTDFYLRDVNVTLLEKEPHNTFGASVKEMEAPLGHSFSCENVTLKVASSLVVTASKVKAQAFNFNGFNYGPAKNCYFKPNMTVPIVVGIVLLVLILVVVLAYIIGRRRRTGGYEML
ncbi:macrosialin [Xenopus laevis]|uniref:Macrosialin n=2 Tax=Xenopus laevis TaxID=8355 RepID=A0A8J0UTT2_XENLA|nr:macrosialin [Xenopus laevis]